MILSATRSLLTPEFTPGFLLPYVKWKYQSSDSIRLKLVECNDGNILMFHHQRSNICS